MNRLTILLRTLIITFVLFACDGVSQPSDTQGMETSLAGTVYLIDEYGNVPADLSGTSVVLTDGVYSDTVMTDSTGTYLFYDTPASVYLVFCYSDSYGDSLINTVDSVSQQSYVGSGVLDLPAMSLARRPVDDIVSLVSASTHWEVYEESGGVRDSLSHVAIEFETKCNGGAQYIVYVSRSAAATCSDYLDKWTMFEEPESGTVTIGPDPQLYKRLRGIDGLDVLANTYYVFVKYSYTDENNVDGCAGSGSAILEFD